MADRDTLNKQVTTSHESIRGKSRGGLLHSVLVVFIALLVVLMVFAGVFYYAVKININGIADKLHPYLINQPLLRFMLPEKYLPEDPDDPKHLSEKEILEKYNEYREKVKVLSAQLEEANNTISELRKELENHTDTEEKIRENQELLRNISEENARLEENIKMFSELLAKGDTASFKEYFEKIDKATAKSIYEKLMTEDSKLEDKKQLAKSFGEMAPKNAANILTELYNKDREKAADIFEGMEDSPRALILQEMDANIAADITLMLSDRKMSRYSIN